MLIRIISYSSLKNQIQISSSQCDQSFFYEILSRLLSLSCLPQFQSLFSYDIVMYCVVLNCAISSAYHITRWLSIPGQSVSRSDRAVIVHQTVSSSKAHVFALLSHLYNSLCQHQA